MNTQQNIVRQEREFKELLQKIMREPLSPINDSVQGLTQRLDQLEQMFRDMREIDLGALSSDAEKVHKQIRSLKSATDEIPQAVRDVMQPLLEQLHTQLEEGKLHEIQELVKELAVQLESASQRTSTQITGLVDSASNSQDALQVMLQRNVAELEDASQSAFTQVQTEVGRMVVDLTGQLMQQSQSDQHSFGRLHELMNQHTQELSEHSAAGLKQVTQQNAVQVGALTDSMEQLQTVFANQKHQVGQMVVDLSGQLIQQSQSGQQSFVHLHALMSQHAQELSEHSSDGLKQVAQQNAVQVAALADSMMQLQTVLADQTHKLIFLQQQQNVWVERVTNQVQHSIQPLRTWLITAVVVAGAACAGVIALLLEKF